MRMLSGARRVFGGVFKVSPQLLFEECGNADMRRLIVMREEIETGMRLLGVTRIEDLKPEHVKNMAREPAPSTFSPDQGSS